MTPGSFLGDWWTLNYTNPYRACITGVDGGGVGPTYNMYVGADKPAATFPAPGIAPVVDGGLSYTVFTTDALQAVGLGYLVRMRIRTRNNNLGQWVTPPADWGTGWMPPATAGLPFYWFQMNRFSTSDNRCGGMTMPNMNSLQDWWDAVNSSPEKRYCMSLGVRAGVRYVLIKPVDQIAQQLDPLSHTVSVQNEIVRGRPGIGIPSSQRLIINHTVNLTIKPLGTCTTPSVVVPFGIVLASGLPPAPGPISASTKTFDLVLKDCPRSNLQYFFRAPPEYTVDNANGVIRRTNPLSGEAGNVGVQLAHNGGVAGTDPVQFNQDGNTTTYTRTPAMGQNNPLTGVTHTIPMRASVYRTSSAPVGGGNLNVAVWVYVQYP